ncbi:hypothetical protein [Lactobacillus agrestimuris]|nr:hypothetical protein [Lactobacillus agrestimuris]
MSRKSVQLLRLTTTSLLYAKIKRAKKDGQAAQIKSWIDRLFVSKS